MKNELLVTIPLKDFIQSHLGISLDESGNITPNQHIWSHRPINKSIADVIFHLCNNEHTCYIEYPSEFSMRKEPILWAYNEWKQSNELQERVKKRAHEERVDRFLFVDNVQMIAQRLVDELGFSYEKAEEFAVKGLKKGNKGLLMIAKVDKLKTKEEEL
jgi:hypothetical protein